MQNKLDPSIHMILPSMGEGVSEATVTRWLKQEGELDESNQPPVLQPNTKPAHIKLTKVNNGFILDMNTDDPSEQPITEVIEVEDISDPDAISGSIQMLYLVGIQMLYLVASRCGIW